MKQSNKARLTLLTGLLMALIMALVILALNIAFSRYIEEEARKAILREADAFRQPELAESGPPVQSPVQAITMLLNEGYTADSDAYNPFPFTPLENAILVYCRANGDTDAVRRVSLLGEDLYLFAFHLPPEQGVQNLAAVIYANVAPLKAFLFRLNAIFLALMLLAGLLAVLAGMRLGRRIDDTQRKLQRFFANASHELKTPLTIIQGYAEGISHGLTHDNRAAGETILKASDRMARLVDELLFLSKVDSGALELKKERFSLHEMLMDCISELMPLARQRNILLIHDIPDSLPLFAGDAANLERAVRNVLSNALRYADRQVSLIVFMLDKRIIIKVKDDGQGVAPKDLPHIFDRFYAGASGQSGVGLSLAREIVQLHGGSLDAENSDSGAVFRFSLPIR